MVNGIVVRWDVNGRNEYFVLKPKCYEDTTGVPTFSFRNRLPFVVESFEEIPGMGLMRGRITSRWNGGYFILDRDMHFPDTIGAVFLSGENMPKRIKSSSLVYTGENFTVQSGVLPPTNGPIVITGAGTENDPNPRILGIFSANGSFSQRWCVSADKIVRCMEQMSNAIVDVEISLDANHPLCKFFEQVEHTCVFKVKRHDLWLRSFCGNVEAATEKKPYNWVSLNIQKLRERMRVDKFTFDAVTAFTEYHANQRSNMSGSTEKCKN